MAAMNGELNYKEANAILDAIEQSFRVLGQEQSVPASAFERWRWDEPGITLTWSENKSGEFLGKNIHALIVGNRVEVEINAWCDKDVGHTGEIRQRHWSHSYVDALEIPLKESELYKIILRAHSKVASWGFPDLFDKTTLPSMSHLQEH